MFCKKETQIEVLIKGEEEPLGFWRPAKILSGNGHTYVVKYDTCLMEKAVLTNKVPRKALRPRPPLGEVKSWTCDDIVEVFDDGSWKLAEVLKILDLNKVAARFLGSLREIVAPILQLRLPHIWKDNHWIPLQKESVKFREVDVKRGLKRRNLSGKIHMLSSGYKRCKLINGCTENQNDYLDQWGQKSPGKLKKKSQRSPVYPHVGTFVKKKQIKKIERCYSLLGKNSTTHFQEKVDAAKATQSFYGEKQMNSFFYHETTGIGQNTIANAEPKAVMTVYHSDNESAASSVGSCSTTNILCRPFPHKISIRQEPCRYIDGAESFCVSSSEPSHSREDEMTETVHCLELDAYHSTLRSLYASGSLNWDQESLLTNLRFALNISSDEHLSALKDLMSTS